MRRALRIGITIGLGSAGESLWLNGIKQNALYLAKLFKGSELGHDVVLLNTTHSPITDDLPWDRYHYRTMPYEEGANGLDVLFELGGQIDADRTHRLKQQDTKVVSYCCGSEYIQNIEAMIFSRRLYDSIFINQNYDALWIIPQLWNMNAPFFQTLRRCPARQVPFVWDPMAIQSATKDLLNHGEYRPGLPEKRISIIEPNIDVLKFCLYPIFIVERAYREIPDLFQFLHVANAVNFVHENREFASLMHYLDIVRAGKASFIGRVTTPTFLADYTDILVSHQWGLPLSYIYLEACWQGYPLVHNADLIKDLGYYYDGNDLQGGAKQLVQAVRAHDCDWQQYLARQRAGIWRFHSENPDLIRQYDDLLFELLGEN